MRPARVRLASQRAARRTNSLRVSPLKAAAAFSMLRSSSVILISILRVLVVGLEVIGRAYGIRLDASRFRGLPRCAKWGARYGAGLDDRKMAAGVRNIA